MTAHHDIDQQLDAFLRDGPDELPYESFDAIRDRTELTGQRVVLGPWRLPEMNRIIGIGAAAAVVVVAIFAGAQLFGSRSGGIGTQSTATPLPTQSNATSEPTASAAQSHLLVAHGDFGIWVTLDAPGWAGRPQVGFLERGENGADPPDGAGLIAFADGEYFVYGDPCRSSSTKPETPATTVDELLDALAGQASREASAPEDISVDGYAGKRIILEMADGVTFDECDADVFALFGTAGDDQARFSQGPGQTEEVWAVDVDGRLVVLDGAYYAETPQAAIDEMRAILASAEFKDPQGGSL